jgi:hypothetical protein
MSGAQACSFCSRGLDEIQELYPSQNGKAHICFDCSRVALQELTEKLPAELIRRPILRARNRPRGRAWVTPDSSIPLTSILRARLHDKAQRERDSHGAYLPRTVGTGILRIPEDVLRLVPRELCSRHTLIPLQQIGSVLIVVIVGTDNQPAADDLKFLTGLYINFIVADKESVKAAIELHYGRVDLGES